MTAITFDTLAFSKQLQESGMPQAQAEALAKAHKTTWHEIVHAQDVATKQDVLTAKMELEQAITKTKNEMLQMKYDLLKWQFTMALGLGAIMAKGFGWLGF